MSRLPSNYCSETQRKGGLGITAQHLLKIVHSSRLPWWRFSCAGLILENDEGEDLLPLDWIESFLSVSKRNRLLSITRVCVPHA